MARRVILASIALAALTTACISPIEDYHGYTADEIPCIPYDRHLHSYR